jgi:hypothetical protein
MKTINVFLHIYPVLRSEIEYERSAVITPELSVGGWEVSNEELEWADIFCTASGTGVHR